MDFTYFLHGLDSSGNGTKGRYFARKFPEILRPDFAGIFEERMKALQKDTEQKERLNFIGSSFGGLMATCYTIKFPAKVKKLILLAPALNFENYAPPAKKISTPTLIIIGKEDTVTPAKTVVPLAEKSFDNMELRLVDDDHFLHRTFENIEWEQLIM